MLPLSLSASLTLAASPPAPLAPGRPRSGTIGGAEVHSFTVDAAEGEWFQVDTRAARLNLKLVLKAPDGRTLVDSYPVWVGDPEAAPLWIAAASGTFTLEVRLRTPGITRTAYELCLSGPRAADAADHVRLRAQTLWLDARARLASPDRETIAEGERFCREGLALAREHAEPRLESRFHRCLSVVHHTRGDYPALLESAQRAIELDAGRYLRAEAASRVDLANVYVPAGDHQQGLEHYEKARAIFHKLGDQVSEAVALGNLGILYCELNDYAKALQLYAQARTILLAQGTPVNVARNHNMTGNALLATGQLARARDTYARALALFRAEKRPEEEGISLVHLGVVHRRLRQPRRAADFLQRGLALIRSVGNPGDEAFALTSLADLYRDLGRHQEALEFYRQSAPLFAAAGRSREQVGAWVAMASLECHRGNLDEARRLIEEVARWLDVNRQGVVSRDLRVSYSGLLREASDVHVRVLMRLHERNPREGFDRAALELSERGRSQALLETLREARVDLEAGIEPALLTRAGELRQELNTKALLQMSRTAASAALDHEIGNLTRDLDQVRSEMRRASGLQAALGQPPVLGLGDFQALLDGGTTLLEYQLGAEGSYAWAVEASALASASLAKAPDIQATAQRLHQRLTVRNRVPAGASATRLLQLVAEAEKESARAAAELSDAVLGPLPAPRGKRLAIVADGALHYVPFGVLPTPASWGGQRVPLADRFEIVSLPSASVLALRRRERPAREPAPRAVAVFADPVFDGRDGRVHAGRNRPAVAAATSPSGSVFSGSGSLNLFRPGLTMAGTSLPRLEYTRVLAEALLEGLPEGDRFKAVDFEASREAALDPSLARYRTIVFATHGLLNAEFPELSGIALSMVDRQGRPRDGFLRLHDVYDLKLNADLVVLGACETGLGKEVKGEGLIGLSRGFMHAGASRVLASLWKVDEEATITLLKEFDRSLRRGLSYPAALREAQLQVRRQPRWSAPYYWAGFVLQGEWRGGETRNQ